MRPVDGGAERRPRPLSDANGMQSCLHLHQVGKFKLIKQERAHGHLSRARLQRVCTCNGPQIRLHSSLLFCFCGKMHHSNFSNNNQAVKNGSSGGLCFEKLTKGRYVTYKHIPAATPAPPEVFISGPSQVMVLLDTLLDTQQRD